jgi:hypothetical protein
MTCIGLLVDIMRPRPDRCKENILGRKEWQEAALRKNGCAGQPFPCSMVLAYLYSVSGNHKPIAGKMYNRISAMICITIKGIIPMKI